MTLLVHDDRVIETTTWDGTGDIPLAGAIAGAVTFVSAMADGDISHVLIESDDKTEWQICECQYLAGANTLTVLSIYSSSNAGAQVAFAAAPLTVGVVMSVHAARSVGFRGHSNEVLLAGLSLVAQAVVGHTAYTGGIRQHSNNSVFMHLQRLCGNGFRIDRSVAVGGIQVGNVAANFDTTFLLNSKPGYCVLWYWGPDLQDLSTGWSDVDAALAATQNAMEIIIARLIAHDIIPILLILPTNEAWAGLDWVLYAHEEMVKWCYDRKQKYGLHVLNAHGVSMRTEAQIPITATLTRAGDLVTATIIGHGFATGDYVRVINGEPSDFDTTDVLPITVVDADTFTLTWAGESASSTGEVKRSFMRPDLSDDGRTHLNAKGAYAIAQRIAPQMQSIFPANDTLVTSEIDLDNMVGIGFTDLNAWRRNLGCMKGTGGTLTTASSVTPTGVVPDGYDVRMDTGSATSLVSSVVARAEQGRADDTWWRLRIVPAADSEGVVLARIVHTLPAAWAQGSRAPGAWRIPTTPNGYWYQVIATTGNANSGTVEPLWPTRSGETVVDNRLTWMAHRAWQDNDLVVCQAEYEIVDQSRDDLLLFISFGLWITNNPITQGDDNFSRDGFGSIVSPGYRPAGPTLCRTPVAPIPAGTASIPLGFKVGVLRGDPLTDFVDIQFTRFTWRNVT